MKTGIPSLLSGICDLLSYYFLGAVCFACSLPILFIGSSSPAFAFILRSRSVGIARIPVQSGLGIFFKLAIGVQLKIGVKRNFLRLAIISAAAVHYTSFLVFCYFLFEEIGFALKRNHIHKIKRIGSIVFSLAA